MIKNPKIFYFPGEYPFCYYYRGYLPGVYSNQLVVKDFLTLRKESSLQAVKENVAKADIVVMQRPTSNASVDMARAIKASGKKLIFENDDTYLVGKGIDLNILETNEQRQIVKTFSSNIDAVMRLADGVIASTPILADEYSKINPNVAVCKNCIDPLDEYPCKKNTTGKFRIGFLGSVTTNDDYIHIKDQIKRLDERGDITIVVLGVKYKNGHHISFMDKDYEFWGSLKNVEWHPYENITEVIQKYADLALDLVVIPRQDSYFNRCKSNLKFLEASLLKIPVIAQGFPNGDSPYQGVDEKYMTVVIDNSTWYDKIIAIRDDYHTFSNLAEQAYNYVLDNYNIESYASVWTETIKKLTK